MWGWERLTVLVCLAGTAVAEPTLRVHGGGSGLLSESIGSSGLTLGGAVVLDRWQPLSGLVLAPQLELALARRGGTVAGDEATFGTRTLDSLEPALLMRGELTLSGRGFHGLAGMYGRAYLRARSTTSSGTVEPGGAPGVGELGWLVGGGFELASLLGGQLFVELRYQRGFWAQSTADASGKPETMSLLLGYGLAATPGQSLASWQSDPSLALKTGFVATATDSNETYGPGFSFGLAFAPVRLGERVAAVPQLELFFVQRHARPVAMGSIDVESLDLSLLVRGDVGIGSGRVFALGGAYGSALLSARRTDDGRTMEVAGAGGSLDAGWMVGAGIELGSVWGARPSLELRYQRSLRDQLVAGVHTPLGSLSVLLGVAYGRDGAAGPGVASTTASPVVTPARFGTDGHGKPGTRGSPRRVRSVVVARQGDRFLDTMQPRRVARAKGWPFGYEVTYEIPGEGDRTFFWPRSHIELDDRVPPYELRWHALGKGRVQYPTAVTRRSLPKVHGSILLLEGKYTKEADGGITAAVAFAEVAGLGTGVRVSPRPSASRVATRTGTRARVAGPSTRATRAQVTRGAATQAPASKAASGVRANRMAGQVGENFLARTYGGASQVTRQTSLGRRVIDNLANGIARESKVGRTALTSRVRSQIAKDAELLASPRSGVTRVEWHFFPGRTGTGPTVPLQRALEEAGIGIVIH